MSSFFFLKNLISREIIDLSVTFKYFGGNYIRVTKKKKKKKKREKKEKSTPFDRMSQSISLSPVYENMTCSLFVNNDI